MAKATKQIGSQVPIIGDSFDNRKDQFLKEVDALGVKYQIALKPELRYTLDGVIPAFKVFDVREASKQPKAEEKPSKQPSS